MIRIRRKIGSAVPEILSVDGRAEKDKLSVEYANGRREFSFKKNIYGGSEVKQTLIEIQGYKCCFCEAKIGHIDDGDVEHFRPKAGWVQQDERLNTPGYYWLAYDWDNLFLCCTKCNQRNKKNYFPLLTPDKRAKDHNGDVGDEDPVFIHPTQEDPETYIAFNEEKVVGIDEGGRGNLTITLLGLDRDLLNENRREKLNPVIDIYDIAKSYPPTYPELQRWAKAKVMKYYATAQLDETEYASMLRCFFRKNPIDF